MGVEELSMSQLVIEYNKLAEKLKQKSIKTFRDRDIALKRVSELQELVVLASKRTPNTPATEGEWVIKRLSRKMFRQIKIIEKHPGKSLMHKRWGRYKDGMTMLEIRTGEGLSTRDVLCYERSGLIKFTEPNLKLYEAELKRRNEQGS